ncbi:MAG: D-alanine--D-alanine ligase [Magnetococcales bacterium]|nr:D-alanine--D-alanine ligase [Magnetococcales bacterium]
MSSTYGKIGLLMGGPSAERQVSLKSGRAMAGALKRRGHEVVEMDVTSGRGLCEELIRSGIERAVLALHGPFGEDGGIQGLLEWLRVPYTGSGIASSALCMNKALSKRVFRDGGLNTPDWWELNGPANGDRDPAMIEKLDRGDVFFVKPLCSGSSVGIARITSRGELERGLREAALDPDGVPMEAAPILVEREIRGVEVTLTILDGEPLPLIEIRPEHGFYDYVNKYTSGKTQYLTPPPSLSPEAVKRAEKAGLRAGELLGCRGFFRVDMILDSSDVPWILEVNTIPGMTELSLGPQAAKAAGISFEELVERILEGASLELCGATS